MVKNLKTQHNAQTFMLDVSDPNARLIDPKGQSADIEQIGRPDGRLPSSEAEQRRLKRPGAI